MYIALSNLMFNDCDFHSQLEDQLRKPEFTTLQVLILSVINYVNLSSDRSDVRYTLSLRNHYRGAN